MTSKPTKYSPGTLVMHPRMGICIIGDDAKWTGTEITYVVINRRKLVPDIPEAALRPLTFGEFLFYTDPATGGLKIGKNKAWPLLFGNALALFGSVYAAVELLKAFEAWMLVQLLVCVGVAVFTLLGTWMNWRNKQM